jgi:ataxia telangiectasia mutated family protein
MEELKKNAPKYVAGLIESYDILVDAYISLAALDTEKIPKNQTKGFSFSKYKLKLDVCMSGGRRGSVNTSLENAPAIISKPPSIRPDAHYGNGIDDPIGTERVVGFESTFELAPSGLHRPAIVICLGSQGGKFKQLVKGDDDMRQDAVMQQVFGTMNNLLVNEGAAKSRSIRTPANQQLKVITYGIAPLSPKAGVLEWLNDTDSFGHFMKGSSKSVGAQSRYYPGMITYIYTTENLFDCCSHLNLTSSFALC